MATAFLQVIAHSSLASQTMLFSEEGKREKPADFTWAVVVTLQKKKGHVLLLRGMKLRVSLDETGRRGLPMEKGEIACSNCNNTFFIQTKAS